MAPPSLTIAFAGDTMLGRGVAEALAGRRPLVAPEVAELAAGADLFVLNLECCISDRGEPWPAGGKPFFFRGPPRAAEVLRELGVDAVTLANNHALDFGTTALLDTIGHLEAAGVAHAGAGPDEAAARAPLVLEAGGLRLAFVAACDHADDFAAGPARPGIAHADLQREPLPGWLGEGIADARRRADVVVVCPHWGPNMVARPVCHVRRAADAMVAAGAGLVVGHSAHVTHGAAGRVLYDTGDFLDDYAVDPGLRNDLGLLFRVRATAHGPIALEAFPLVLEYCHTRLADADDAELVLGRFAAACTELGAQPSRHPDRVTVPLAAG